MDEKMDLASFMDNAPIITITIAKIETKIRVFFSINCYKIMFKHHEQGDDYRSAFAAATFYMFQQTTRDNVGSISEQDFINTTGENLIIMLNAILEQDGKLKLEYDNVQTDDVYERFYKANEVVLKSATAGISKSLAKMSESFELQNKALSSSLGNAMKNLVPPDYLSGLISAIANMPKFDFPQFHSALSYILKIPTFGMSFAVQDMQRIDFQQFKSALANVPHIQFPQLASVMANIPKPVFDIQAFIAPLQSFSESIRHINDGLAQTLQAPLIKMAKATQSLLASVDFSLLAYCKKWSEQRETLLKYEWFYSDELPDDLHDKQSELGIDEIDKLIIDYFRRDRCKALKSVVKGWSGLPYFRCRAKVFHEALVNHSRRYFNSSVTLLTVHTEGVITDFVRISLKNPRFSVENAIKDIKKELGESEKISIYEYEVYNDVIERIEVAFNENFKHSDPDATSNTSRHKIAHGHAYEPENEVNSLKRFLYLNEIYYLFSSLHCNAPHCQDTNLES
jgi:hypothetical protein